MHTTFVIKLGEGWQAQCATCTWLGPTREHPSQAVTDRHKHKTGDMR